MRDEERQVGRPKGWHRAGMSKQGLLDQQAALRTDQLEALEAFCCAQVARLEDTIRHRYSLEEGLLARPAAARDLMPQNDGFIRPRMGIDCDVEVRGTCTGWQGKTSNDHLKEVNA